MARPKQKWTSEEEAALQAGVRAHREGKWKEILTDRRFASILANRSNVNLKDKWRNMSGSDYGSSSRVNANTSLREVTNDQLITCPEPCRSQRRAPRYKKMIYEALSSIEDPSGTDVNKMVKFLEPKYDVPKNFRSILSSKLRKLVQKGDLEEVNQRYKVKGMSSGAKTSQQEDHRRNKFDNEQVGPQSHCEEPFELATETIEDAARVAAFQVALAETKECRLIENSEDTNKLAEVLDEGIAMLMLAEDLYKQCKKDGRITLLP